MNQHFNYSYMFSQALNKIKAVRAPHSDMIEKRDLHWDDVKRETLFDFGNDDFENSIRVYSEAKKISTSCFQFIVEYLLKDYGYSFETIPLNSLRPSVSLSKTQLESWHEIKPFETLLRPVSMLMSITPLLSGIVNTFIEMISPAFLIM